MKKISKTLKYSFLLSFILFFTSFAYSQETNTLTHQIKGTVTFNKAPLSNVNIIIKGTQRGTKTDAQGKYSIKAKTGAVIVYTYVGFNAVSILVEDVTAILNIEMDAHVNTLDEVVLTKEIKKAIDLPKALDINIKMANGTTINPLKYGFAVHYLDNKSLSMLDHSSIEAALSGRFSGLTTSPPPDRILLIRGVRATFDIDGQLYERAPAIAFSDIEHVFIIKNKALVVIRTKSSIEVLQHKKEALIEKSKNQNFYKDDATTVKKETVFSTNALNKPKNNIALKEIKGKITYLNTPLKDVNISIKNRGTKTNAKGLYLIKANVGDVLKFSHVSFKTIFLIVEDITTTLNIEMIPQVNKLDEVIVEGSSENDILKNAKKAEKKFSSSRGNIDPKKAGFAISFVDGEEINPGYSTLSQALVGKFPGARIDRSSGKFVVKSAGSMLNVPPVLWDIDGAIYRDEPNDLDINQIKSVHIIKSLAGTNRYGSAGAGGVVVVRTKYGSYDPVEAKRKKMADKYTNKNYYDGDATVLNTEALYTNIYTDKLQAFNNLKKAYAYYNNSLKEQLQDYAIHISIAQKFMSYYQNANVTLQILEDLIVKHSKNPEILKAIAFQFQALGFKKETIKVYESIFKLRPAYAQSFRDLANAYTENDLYKKAWRLYMAYLLNGNKVNGEGIGQTLYNEMEWLFFNRNTQADIRERFIPKNEDIYEFRNDVRLVFEWNTSEAEFDLEFVNPEKRVYTFEHSLEKNQTLITDEKKKGYSSKEFFIDDIGKGEWLVNITYKGNKKPEPTYFKVTQYLNWGKTNQTRKIEVYTFINNSQKIQLLNLDYRLLVSSK